MSNPTMPVSPGAGSSVSNNAKLFVGGLSYETTDDSLETYFSGFGQVASAVVLRDPDTKRSRGFGFVTFTKPESARLALSQQHHTIDNRRVEAKFAEPKKKNDGAASTMNTASDTQGGNHHDGVQNAGLVASARATPVQLSASTRSSPQQLFSPNTMGSTVTTMTAQSGDSVTPPPAEEIVPRKVFVGGLKYSTTDEILREYFAHFGAIESTQIPFNRDTRKSRGFGYVVFKDQGPVEQVLARQRISPHFIEGKQVEIKVCTPRQVSDSGGSPRTVPQTPIMPPRSDSYSSLTSSTSMQRPNGVSATPVRPSSTAILNSSLPAPPVQFQQPPLQMSREWVGLTSPVTFEDPSVLPTNERRASFASVRSTSPFGAQLGFTGALGDRMSATAMFGVEYVPGMGAAQRQQELQMNHPIRVDGASVRVEGPAPRYQGFGGDMMQQAQQQQFDDAARWRNNVPQQQQQPPQPSLYGFDPVMGRKPQQHVGYPGLQQPTTTGPADFPADADAGLFNVANIFKGYEQQGPLSGLSTQPNSRFHPVAPRTNELPPPAVDHINIDTLLGDSSPKPSVAEPARKPVQEGASLPPINFRPLAGPSLPTTSPARQGIARSPLFDQSGTGSAFAPLPKTTPGSIW